MEAIKYFMSEKNKILDKSKERDTFERRHYMSVIKFNRIRRKSDFFCKCE
jgi:hypothetical protein